MVNACHWVALKSTYLLALNTSMKINGSVGERFLIYERSSQIEAQEGSENAYVVTVSTREHRGIAGLKVESPRSGTPGERGGPPVSGKDVKPF